MACRPGDRVLQPTYGVGDVIEVSGNHVTISFDDGVVRKFVASMAQLTATDDPRPDRPRPKARARKTAAKATSGVVA
jgi:hypothetical protein